MCHRLVFSLLLLILVDAASVTALFAQGPELLYLHPPSAVQGGEVEAEFAGKGLESIERLYFSRPGIEARLLGKGRVAIRVAPDVPSGDCDVWAASAKGLSGPARLAIDVWPVHAESEPNNAATMAQRIELPAIVCGRIDPGTDGDWYRVRLTAGDGLTLNCRSLSLGGTVWPTLIVLNPQGREIAHDTLTQSEPTVHVTADSDGEYTICVQERSYRSSKMPIYRLAMTTGPWLVAAYPPSLARGQSQPVTLYGYSLPGGNPVENAHAGLQQLADITVSAPKRGEIGSGWTLSRALFGEQFTFRQESVGGSVRLELLDQPAWLAPAGMPATSTPTNAPLLTLPVDVVGRFASRREVVHWYRFLAKKGETLWLETAAERLDRPCDLELIVYDATGKPLETFGNVALAKGQTSPVPLETRDPEGAWKVPTTGEYRLAVRDLLAAPHAPVERAYRLSMGPRLEDVRVVAKLDNARGWSVAAGKTLKVELVAIRRGGHEGPIEIRAEDAPPGLTIQPTTISAKQSSGTLTISAAADAPAAVRPLRLVATSEVNGQQAAGEVIVVAPLPEGTPLTGRLCDEAVIAILDKPAKAAPTTKP